MSLFAFASKCGIELFYVNGDDPLRLIRQAFRLNFTVLVLDTTCGDTYLMQRDGSRPDKVFCFSCFADNGRTRMNASAPLEQFLSAATTPRDALRWFIVPAVAGFSGLSLDREERREHASVSPFSVGEGVGGRQPWTSSDADAMAVLFMDGPSSITASGTPFIRSCVEETPNALIGLGPVEWRREALRELSAERRARMEAELGTVPLNARLGEHPENFRDYCCAVLLRAAVIKRAGRPEFCTPGDWSSRPERMIPARALWDPDVNVPAPAETPVDARLSRADFDWLG